MVRYREIAPSARMRPYVACFWILEDDGQSCTPQRVIPDGRPELILNWKEPFQVCETGHCHKQTRAFLAGQLEGPLLLRPNGPAQMLGVRFHPHGAALLFGCPMRELTGRFTAVEDFSPRFSRRLNEILEVPDPISSVEDALTSVISSRPGDPLIAEVVQRITLAKGAIDLAELARQLGLGIRQLERRFLMEVGLPPKLFCRIQRLNRIFPLLDERPANWVETAIECCYYDQAHLIRECRSLAGTTPAVLLADEADFARHFYMRGPVSHLSNTARAAAL